ncbi:MAG: OB-fold nucleic acid binding domain-containing protein [Candidatus Aenigmatarchaeota archaeon]|nr:OB-fold nucleic acid binding domain-containing protein [Candidatus Aenigmarchaeota archaeon]
MKLSKKYLILLSLISSLVGLALIYIATINLEPKQIAISEISADMEGRKISTTGYLVNKKEHKDGHLFLTVSDDKAEIQVVLFSDLMKSLSQIGITPDNFKLNVKIAVKGILENYKGRLEIIPKSLNDIKILGD